MTGLFCEHSDAFLGTWPSSGSMRCGVAYELPMWAPPTADFGSSSSRLLATPTAAIAVGGPPQDSRGKRGLRLDLLPTPAAGNFNDEESVESWQARKEREKAKGRNGNGIGTPLAMAVQLLPTPRATDGTKGGPNQRGSSGDLMLPSAVVSLLPTPTPTASDRFGAGDHGDGGMDLRTTISLLSTGDSSSPQSDAGNQ